MACGFDGTTCEVTLFTDAYKSMNDIPIVTAATAWTNEETGETLILLFHQVLWYGKKLENSLLNPNQLRYHGLSVSDDITDKTRLFGIELDEDLVIPFEIRGTNVYFVTRVPMRWEMENSRVFVITDDTPWDPENVSIAVISNRTSMNKFLHGGIQGSNSPSEILILSDIYDDSTFATQLIASVNIVSQHANKRAIDQNTTKVAFIGAKN
jgi:hypothetical protein